MEGGFEACEGCAVRVVGGIEMEFLSFVSLGGMGAHYSPRMDHATVAAMSNLFLHPPSVLIRR